MKDPRPYGYDFRDFFVLFLKLLNLYRRGYIGYQLWGHVVWSGFAHSVSLRQHMDRGFSYILVSRRPLLWCAGARDLYLSYMIR